MEKWNGAKRALFLATCNAGPRYDAQTRKVWVWVKLGGLLTFRFVAEALTLKALVTLVVLVRALGITSYFALAFSLSDRYHYLPSVDYSARCLAHARTLSHSRILLNGQPIPRNLGEFSSLLGSWLARIGVYSNSSQRRGDLCILCRL